MGLFFARIRNVFDPLPEHKCGGKVFKNGLNTNAFCGMFKHFWGFHSFKVPETLKRKNIGVSSPMSA
jgi:hypothetical protein